ncbi:MAG: DUF2155 domain-containing protein [Shimia sp.]
MRWFALCLTLAAGAVQAQGASTGVGADVRLLDRVTGLLEDLSMRNGQSARLGGLRITLRECRYPPGNASGDAYALMTVTDDTGGALREVFSGWMIASSPALNAMDHPRYDVWVLRCRTS